MHEIMSKDVRTVTPARSAEDAWREMRLQHLHHLVVMEGRAISGVISERDLGGRRGATLRRNATVGELMTHDVVTATPDTQVRKAANLLRGRAIGCLPIVAGQKLVGIVTISDLLELVGSGAERPVQESVRWTLRKRGPRKMVKTRGA